MALLPGTRLGPYEVVAQIGAGGMGEVYRARDTKLDRDVAIKVLPEETAHDPDRRRRFEREARAASSLNHPNIVTIYEIGEAGGTVFIAMELVRGTTLRAALAAGPIPLEKLVRYARQLIEGLAKAHAAGLVHRDLKPENVIITGDDFVKILDFGLAKRQSATGDGSSDVFTMDVVETQPGAIAGTLAYMSPEQARGARIDFRSDQFSLGAMLHEMVTGRAVFRRDSAAETLAAILRDVPEPLARVSPMLGSIVGRCLSKRPEDRYESTGELLRELGRVSSAATRPIPSVAVLPFTNLSSDVENEYFSDGLTEEIITDLSKVSGMKVVSRASAMRFKGTAEDVRTLGAELRVGYVLRGGVRRVGHNLRVTAQLVDVDNDEHLWAEKYAGTLDDVFEIQEAVSRRIVEALKVRLTSDEDRRIGETPITDARAYDCYLRARHEYSRGTQEGVELALRYLDEGLKIVGPNALLFAAKGHAFFSLAIADTLRHREHLESCRGWAERIFELEPDSARGHALLGVVMADLFDVVDGIRHMERAFELEPNDLDNLSWLTIYQAFVGHRERSAWLAERLLDRDGMNPFSLFVAGFFVRFFGGQLDEAEHLLAKAHAMVPEVPIYRTAYAQIVAARGRTSDAIELLAQLERRPPTHAWGILGLILKRALEGDEARVTELLTEPLEEAFKLDQLYAYLMGERYALLGHSTHALEWLEVAINAGCWNSSFIASDPLLRSLQSMPELARLIGLARQHSRRFDAA